MAIGVWLLLNRMGTSKKHSDHGHQHPHPHTHHQLEPQNNGGLRVTWRNLAALGVVGGLVPSTSALVILLGAIAMQRVEFGLLLVFTFSAGMALVLGGVGLLLVYATRTVERVSLRNRWMAGISKEVPLIAAVVVLVSGLVMTTRALYQIGLG